MEKESDQYPRVLVCQHGARHRYAIPRLLEESGMLAALYTDSSAYSLMGRIALRLMDMGVSAGRLQALGSRVPEGIPKSKILSTDRGLRQSLQPDTVSTDHSRVFHRHGLRGANVLYNIYGENLSFLEWAKKQGCRIVIDVIIHPGTNRIVAEETAVILGQEKADLQSIAHMEEHSRRVFGLADMLLCPSSWVADGVRELVPESAGKIRVLPYGSSLKRSSGINESPEPGRLLFAGRDPLRKGLHYLADASKIVRQSGMAIDVRVAGLEASDVRWMQNRDALHFLGNLPLDRMHEEFEQADVFILPSLSEGQAGVLLEAMASGCPVIATRESGVDFDPDSGLTVPARNAETLADAIKEVVGNRARRNRLAHGALRQAALFSTDEWKSRLVSAMNDVIGNL